MVTKNVKITNLTSNKAVYNKILSKTNLKIIFSYKGKKRFMPSIPVTV